VSNGTITSRVPYEDYARVPAVSITRLKELKRSGLHYQHVLKEGLPETDALRLGIAAHTATLEPERFARQFAIWDRRGDSGNLCPRRGQYWDAFVAHNAGKHIITEDDHQLAIAIANAVQADPLASRYLATGEPEVSLQWETWVEAPLGLGRMVPCRGRVDWITHLDGVPHLIGLKTARDVSPLFFGSAAYRLGYHLQWSYYHDALQEIKNQKPVMKEIVVESKPPFDVVVYNVTQEVLEQGRDDYLQLLKVWVECENSGVWAGVANGVELDITLPTYAYPSVEDIIGLELEQ
jgi:PDDEXK-like domain of unknown function (DUF3799)